MVRLLLTVQPVAFNLCVAVDSATIIMESAKALDFLMQIRILSEHVRD
jgi:hypothetical protein